MKKSMNTADVLNADAVSSIVLVCEHASHYIPTSFNNLGLNDQDRLSHAVWDIGALNVSRYLSMQLEAKLVISNVSRLVYDCNRPPEAVDAMPSKTENILIPGNKNLNSSQRAERTETYYKPFKLCLGETLATLSNPILVTVHSFTPTYHGKNRSEEIGVLHDSDTRLADAMLEVAAKHTQANVQRNQPYGPEDGVTHTLKEHAIANGYLNVMLEIRNDLIQTEENQKIMADLLAAWIIDAVAQTKKTEAAKC